MITAGEEDSTSIREFAKWIDINEKKLNTACHCEPKQSWKNVIEYHKNIQFEVEDLGKRMNDDVKGQLNDLEKRLNEAEKLSGEVSDKSSHFKSDKSSLQQLWDEATDLEKRWHKLWLKSLEQLVVVERTRRCPSHNSTIIGKPTQNTPSNKSLLRTQRKRPLSYPNNVVDRMEWDHRDTLVLTGCYKENGSQKDLESVDEQRVLEEATKKLTFFGENYELYFGQEDEVACDSLHSRPASCEPSEQPEIAKAIVTSNAKLSDNVNCNLLMLTTPSSMLSVDAGKFCSPSYQRRNKSSGWRYFCPIILLLGLVLISALFKEPHQLHKAYHHSRPPI